MKVRWRTEARGDLDRIIEYISPNSVSGARRMVRRIRDRARQLASFPYLGRPGPGGYRELVVGGTPYILVYRVEEKTVDIYNIFHGAQDRP